MTRLTGLILQGGGSRGVYTAGVLDVLTKNDIFLPVTYGVSAGACNALSYISKQEGRNRRIFTEFASDKRYCSLKLLLKTGSLFGFDFIFGDLAYKLLPFDFREFERSLMELKICATDCDTGKAVFFDKSDIGSDFLPVIASASLPVVSRIVEYKGLHLLDGGVAAPIPIDYAIRDGVTKNIVVLTRPKDYVKKDKTDFPLFYLKHKYKAYPALVEAMKRRASVSNKEHRLCFEEEEKGNAIVISPSVPINISRSCTKSSTLNAIYRLGVRDAKAKLKEINRFIAFNE